MKYSKIIFPVFAAIMFALPSKVHSQTCVVRSSTLQNGCPVYTEVYEYDYVEEKPQFPGGDTSLIDFINSTRIYPPEAYESGIEGRVTCSFIVQENGKISHIQILRGVEKSLNQEAIRIVSNMPTWQPGKINNRPVPVRVIRCIPFRK